MKRFILLMLGTICCLGFAYSVYAELLETDDAVFVRSNLYADGNAIYWHNMNAFAGVVPVATEVKIVKSTDNKISFTRVDNNKDYVLVTNAAQWDKYFVKDKTQIGLEDFSSNEKDKIINGEVVTGMTKKEAYASRGCPAYIAYGIKSNASTFGDIMQSDTWYYMKTSRAKDVLVKFENSVVSSIESY